MKVIFKNTKLILGKTNGLTEEIKSYLGKLSVTPTEEQSLAFSSFYITLKEANLWDKILTFLPMFGKTVYDCSYAVKGKDISPIPIGASYDYGLNIMNVTNGLGPSGKGIKLAELSNTLSEFTAFGATAREITGISYLFEYSNKNFTSSSTEDTLYEVSLGLTENTVRFPLNKNITITNARQPHVVAFSHKIITPYSSAIARGYIDGNMVHDESISSGEMTLPNSNKYWYLGRKNSVPSKDSCLNMFMIFNSILTDNEILLVSNAIKKLQNVLYK